MLERLQKILAHAGVASRRKAETLIEQGHVTVNGKVVRELGSKADIDEDVIQVDGRTIRETQDKVYYVLYKPAACVTPISPRCTEFPPGSRSSDCAPECGWRTAGHARWRRRSIRARRRTRGCGWSWRKAASTWSSG